MNSEFPDVGELVICKVKRVQNFGAFVDVIGYNREGYIHISQVASRWIKNIRNHIREGQSRVGMVTRIDRDRGLVDISLRKVSKDQERKRMEIWKHSKKAEALIKIAARSLKLDANEFISKVMKVLEKEYVDVFDAFEEALVDGEQVFKGIDPKWAKELVKIAKENVKIPTIDIKGTVNIQFTKPDGIDFIKKAFESVDKRIKVSYISAPKYTMKITGEDPKEMDKLLTENVGIVQKFVEGNKGTFEFIKEK